MPRHSTAVLLAAVFVIAICGLIYELLASTVASYLLGDSVTQFSTVIGVYLFAMGVGSYLSRFFERELLAAFLRIEMLVGLVGGLSSLVLFLAFAELAAFRVVLYGWVLATGILVGLEIPILLRLLKDELDFSDLVSRVLSLDYLGALLASLLFPLWLVPRVGLMRSSFVFGVLNVLVAVAMAHLFHREHRRTGLLVESWVALAVLLAGAVFADDLTRFTESRLYDDPVVLTRQSPYQRIVLTHRPGGDVKLFLNGELQLSTRDEYRYHEALVHPVLAAHKAPLRVLVLGGGDGMAVREVLKDPRVENVVLVDLDPEMTALFRDHPRLAELNDGALRSPRVRIDNADAFVWLEATEKRFDVVIVDFPDPSSYSLGKLYTTTFYRILASRLAPGGMAAIQSTSPFSSQRAFWCVVRTVRAAELLATPYHAPVPSFGEWGFVIASREPYRPPTGLPPDLSYLTPGLLPSLFEFPADMAEMPVEVNRLDNQILVSYLAEGWGTVSPWSPVAAREPSP